eukprot:COSAG04_NODE_17397_length_470_cov_1.000000_1_plen_51_part_00
MNDDRDREFSHDRSPAVGSERGGDDDFNDNCEVPASEDAEMMGWDTYDDG